MTPLKKVLLTSIICLSLHSGSSGQTEITIKEKSNFFLTTFITETDTCFYPSRLQPLEIAPDTVLIIDYELHHGLHNGFNLDVYLLSPSENCAKSKLDLLNYQFVPEDSKEYGLSPASISVKRMTQRFLVLSLGEKGKIKLSLKRNEIQYWPDRIKEKLQE